MEVKYQSFLLHPPHHRETASAWTCSWCGEHLIRTSVPSLSAEAKERASRRCQSLHWVHCWHGQWPSWGPPAPPGRHFGGARNSAGLSSRFHHCCQRRPRCPLGLRRAQSSSCLVNQMPPGEQRVSRDKEGSIPGLFDIHLLNHTQENGWSIFVFNHFIWYKSDTKDESPSFNCLTYNQQTRKILFLTENYFKIWSYISGNSLLPLLK